MRRDIYGENCTQSTFSMPKAMAQIGPDEWAKDDIKAKTEWQ